MLVARLWQATDLAEQPPVWEPDESGIAGLTTRRLRWGWVLWLLLFAAAAAGGWWYWQQTTTDRALEAQRRVAAEAAALESALAGMEAVWTGEDAAARIAAIDAAARELFEAASGLPTDALATPETSQLRLQAADLAGAALETTATVGEVLAYRLVFQELVVPPELPLSVDSAQLPDVAADVAWWVTRASDAASALPTHPRLGDHPLRTAEWAAGLEGWQGDYLEALRSGDVTAARAARQQVLDELERLRTDLDSLVADVQEWASGESQRIRDGLAPLGAAS